MRTKLAAKEKTPRLDEIIRILRHCIMVLKKVKLALEHVMGPVE
jgi:hypothetical protein